jgi:hypothetical protein
VPRSNSAGSAYRAHRSQVRTRVFVVMRTHPALMFLLWLLGAAAALALSFFCVLVGSDGKISALGLIPFVWTVAMLCGALKCFPGHLALQLCDRLLAAARIGAPLQADQGHFARAASTQIGTAYSANATRHLTKQMRLCGFQRGLASSP